MLRVCGYPIHIPTAVHKQTHRHMLSLLCSLVTIETNSVRMSRFTRFTWLPVGSITEVAAVTHDKLTKL